MTVKWRCNKCKHQAALHATLMVQSQSLGLSQRHTWLNWSDLRSAAALLVLALASSWVRW